MEYGGEYLPKDIREQLKNKYGVSMNPYPTKEEMKNVLDAWASEVSKKVNEIKTTTNRIISNQDSTLSKIENTLKRIDELDRPKP